MLSDLRFVQGAISRKTLIPAMAHFAIARGHVRAYNGMIALSGPIPFDIDCKPRADTLVRAINNCPDTIQLSMTEAGRLRVQSGAFRAFVDCVHEETPHVMPEGERVVIDGDELLRAVQTVYSFIGDDASRPWSSGVLLRGQSAFATNNVTLIEYWIGSTFPATVCIPRVAVKEMLRISEAPSSMQLGETSVTFHYPGDRWLRTQLLSCDWPDLGRVLDVDAHPQPLPAGLFEALEAVAPFTDKLGRVFFRAGTLCTHATDDEGAVHELAEAPETGIYGAQMLGLLNGVAQRADFALYPKPCIFYGDRVRGAIIGLR